MAVTDTRKGRLWRWLSLILGVVWIVALLGAGDTYAQQGPNRAGLVIRYSDDQVETYCVSFTEPAISGLELLRRSGVHLVVDTTQSWGAAVCRIGDTGCAYPQEPCFCQCPGSPCVYWAYYHLKGDHWEYSDVGAGQYTVRPGAVEGWSWGQGLPGQGTPPPVISFEAICSTNTGGVLATGPTETPGHPLSGSALWASLLPFIGLLLVLMASAGWMARRRKA